MLRVVDMMVCILFHLKDGMNLGILGALCLMAGKSQIPTFSANTDLFQMPLQTTKVRY